jgi:hypothetical protein
MSSLDQTIREMPQRCAVAKLVGHCEGLISSGLLGEKLEMTMRQSVAETLAAFNMPSITERGDLSVIKSALERTR